MSKDNDKLHNEPGGEDELSFSLEEILAEFSTKKEAPAIPVTPAVPTEEPAGGDLPWPEPARPNPKPNNVVPFPGPDKSAPAEGEPAQPATPEHALEADVPAEAVEQKTEEPGETEKEDDGPEEAAVIDFPEEETLLSDLWNQINQKADDYASHMFEEEGAERDDEVRRMETLIPGVDEETDEPPIRERRPRREAPPPPDLSPQTLFQQYGKGLKSMRVRSLLLLIPGLICLYLALAASFPLPLPTVLNHAVQVWISAGCLAVSMLLATDVILGSLGRIFRLKLGMDAVVSLGCFATLADSCTMLYLTDRNGQLPYCVISIFSLFFLLRGALFKQRGLRLACRTAAAASEPYLVTLDEGKWNGRDTYTKWFGSSRGFGSQIQQDDGAQQLFQTTAPIFLLAAALFSLISSLGQNRPEHFLWCLSATLTAAGAFSATLVYGRPFFLVSHRLAQSGAALAGWVGVRRACNGNGILVTDLDLFPPGCVTLNGIKVFGDFSTEKIIGYTATLIRDSGSGLERIFHDLLRTQGALYRQASGLCCYEGGGLSATIRSDQVQVGSAAFMSLMEVSLPDGLNIKNAVFCAVNGELAGIFALNYTLHGTVVPALDALLHNKVGPVLATRDFNVIPTMLRQRFKLATDRMEFPPVARRRELSDPDQEHGSLLTAVLCREGLAPFSEAVVGGKRLCAAVRMGAVVTCVSSAVGLLLSFYLTFVSAYSSLSPENLLVFMLVWLIPTYILSSSVTKY